MALLGLVKAPVLTTVMIPVLAVRVVVHVGKAISPLSTSEIVRPATKLGSRNPLCKKVTFPAWLMVVKVAGALIGSASVVAYSLRGVSLTAATLMVVTLLAVNSLTGLPSG